MSDHNYGSNAGDQGRSAYGGRSMGGRYGGRYDDDYFTDQGFNNTQGELVNTPLGQITGMHHKGGNAYGGTHHTVYGNDQRISWDTDTNDNYVDGSVHQKAN